MKNIIKNIIKSIGISMVISNILKLIMGRYHSACYNPIADQIGLKQQGKFIEAEQELIRHAPDIWLHEDGHRRIWSMVENKPLWLAVRQLPLMTLADEVMAWIVAYKRAGSKRIKIRPQVVAVGMATYVAAEIIKIIKVIKFIRWIKRRIKKS